MSSPKKHHTPVL